jgi:hypothetical protein
MIEQGRDESMQDTVNAIAQFVKLLPLPHPPVRARTDAQTNPSAQRATQLRSVLARVYAVSNGSASSQVLIVDGRYWCVCPREQYARTCVVPIRSRTFLLFGTAMCHPFSGNYCWPTGTTIVVTLGTSPTRPTGTTIVVTLGTSPTRECTKFRGTEYHG